MSEAFVEEVVGQSLRDGLKALDEASAIADRLRIEPEESLPGGGTVTVSVGVASCGRTIQTSRGLVGKADSALYLAKRSGKNRGVVAPDGAEG